jgi:hypothetical protein
MSAHIRKSSNILESRKNYFEEIEDDEEGNNIYGYYVTPQKICMLPKNNSDNINGQLLKSELCSDRFKNKITKATPSKHLRSSSLKMIF